ncbi:MAG: hypothetical protein ACT4OM_03745 [Actinomycetota bacterium]
MAEGPQGKLPASGDGTPDPGPAVNEAPAYEAPAPAAETQALEVPAEQTQTPAPAAAETAALEAPAEQGPAAETPALEVPAEQTQTPGPAAAETAALEAPAEQGPAAGSDPAVAYQGSRRESTRQTPAYFVAPPLSIGNDAAPPCNPTPRHRTSYAVLVTHGMGQSVPFATMAPVAEKIRKADLAGGFAGAQCQTRQVRTGEDHWLNRVELNGIKGDRVDAHFYEGYWAPLTEGKIQIRGVLHFLQIAGTAGIRNGVSEFRRWLLGDWVTFKPPIRTVFYLLVALATVASLVVMNSAIAALAASSAFLQASPEWLSEGLEKDLTTTFSAVVVALALFGISLGLTRFQAAKGKDIKAVQKASVVLFALAIAAVVLGAVSIGLIFYGHVKGFMFPDEQLWQRVFAGWVVTGINGLFRLLLGLGLAGSVVVLGLNVLKVWRAYRADAGSVGHRWTVLVGRYTLGLFVAALLLALILRVAIPGFVDADTGGYMDKLAWAVLAGASLFIRKILVQFVGDVAIYVTPYTLDQYYELREDIRKAVLKTARAIYSARGDDGCPLYDRVVIVGHSLGSVVSYDTLNDLISEGQLDPTLKVVERTSLLLTFGSPLDKIAFLFGIQSSMREPRETLSASRQPMIQSYGYRPKEWVNIYSPWDLISGSLDLYDDKSTPPDDRAVKNIVDPKASTLLAAHVEYWDSDLIYRTIYSALKPIPAADSGEAGIGFMPAVLVEDGRVRFTD